MGRDKELTTYYCNIQQPALNAENQDDFVDADGAAAEELFVAMGRKKEKERQRQQWTNSIEFLLSCVAMSVGLGNIWRFPFTAYENGGGAFLIPYLIVLLVIGRPMCFLELAIGQFSSLGHVKIWKMSPLFKGVGYASTFVTFCVTSYYCTISATTLRYFFASFQPTLPWTECDPDWDDVTCDKNGNAWINTTVVNSTSLNMTYTSKKTSIPALYYRRSVLKQIDSIDDGIGRPDLSLALCLLFFWFAVFGSTIKGVQSSGKIAYFTAIFPYIVLLVLLITSLTLPGAWDGVLYFITPQFHKLLEAKVWFAAIEQCFYSLSVGFGPVIMNGSYNPFRHDVYKAALILGFMDTFTSLLAGVTVFAILGHLKLDLNVTDILQVTNGGSSLAFESYPLIISKFGWAPTVFGALFFLMLFTLGCGSTISDTGSIVTVIHDQFPQVRKVFITAGFCVVAFFSGLLYITPGGGWMLELIDYYGCVLVIVFTTALEVMGICWVYGLNNLVQDIEFMLPGRKIGAFWKICWGFVIPVGLSIILFETLRNVAEPTFEGKQFPAIAIWFGWCLCGFGLLILPLCAIHAVATRKSKSLLSKFKESMKPSLSWGPRENRLHFEWSQLPPAPKLQESLKNVISCQTNES